jgi:hypothetical protein
VADFVLQKDGSGEMSEKREFFFLGFRNDIYISKNALYISAGMRRKATLAMQYEKPSLSH